MAKLTVGETLKILIEAPESAGDGEMRIGGPMAATVPVMSTVEGWVFKQETAGMLPGSYAYQVWATFDDGTKAIVSRGTFVLVEALSDGQDVRSTARKNLDAIEAMLGKSDQVGVRRYRINNRELERYSVAELLKLRSFWALEVRKEERLASGKGALGPRIAFRF